MKELAMALWTMTASHYQWQMPPEQPVAVIRTAEENQTINQLTRGERKQLRKALERMARCSAGTLLLNSEVGMYVPDKAAECK